LTVPLAPQLAAPEPAAENVIEEPKETADADGKFSRLLKYRWIIVAASALIIAGSGVYLFLRYRSQSGEVAVEPKQEEQLTVGLVSFKPDKVAIINNTQFQVTLHKDFSVPEIYLCDVTFAEKPAPAEIDKILRDALEQCVKKDGTQEILAMAYVKEQALRPPDYSGPLVWSPEEKAIKPLNR
jgi:hypothetical protein